jgi:D-3-phosphoglycerate dehydrogenase
MQKLLICYKQEPVEPIHLERISAVWSDVEIVNVGQDRVAAELLSTDYFLGHAKVPVDWDEVVKRGRLRWIQSSAAGMDWCLVPSVIASDITITTASGVLADQVAEHTLSLILGWLRNLPTFLREQHDSTSDGYRKFIRRPTRDLSYANVCIVGFGGVGRRLAEVLLPFGCTIDAIDLFTTNKPDYVANLLPPDKLDEVLPTSDIVILSLPLNSETRNVFNKDKFNKMKPTALFANMARGHLVVTDDLLEAITNKTIAGAVMDVTSPEPLPPYHKLWNQPNVIITPHVGGQFKWRFDLVTTLFCENVKRKQTGKPLINLLSQEGKRLGFPLRSDPTPLWSDVRKEIVGTLK